MRCYSWCFTLHTLIVTYYWQTFYFHISHEHLTFTILVGATSYRCVLNTLHTGWWNCYDSQMPPWCLRCRLSVDSTVYKHPLNSSLADSVDATLPLTSHMKNTGRCQWKKTQFTTVPSTPRILTTGGCHKIWMSLKCLTCRLLGDGTIHICPPNASHADSIYATSCRCLLNGSTADCQLISQFRDVCVRLWVDQLALLEEV